MALTSWWHWFPSHQGAPSLAGPCASAFAKRVQCKPHRCLYKAQPSSADGIINWAEQAFEQEACRDPINLAKACMLISLEEEAAEEASQASYLSAEGLEQDSLGRLRSTSAASTWNLERLEALAAEVAALFYTRCQELGVAGDLQAASNAGAPDSGLLDLHLALVRAYPTQLLGAVNDVVFGQQGYAKMQRHGDPRDSLLSSVLERGRGSPAALAIMYREVCARLGLPMHAAVLEGGGYLVLWPADAAVHLTAAGERLVVDPFAGGALYSMEEVALLFDIRIGPQGIRPATSRELLGALLKSLQDSHWCRSMGCPPEPALMTPISLDLALGSPDDHATGGGEVEPSVNACQAFSSEEASVPGEGHAAEDEDADQAGSKSSSLHMSPGPSSLAEEAVAASGVDQTEAGGDEACSYPGHDMLGDNTGARSHADAAGHPTPASGEPPDVADTATPAASSSPESRVQGPPWHRSATALGWPTQGHHLERALAAARKRAVLLPQSRGVRLDYALLLFFSGQYAASHQEMEAILQGPSKPQAVSLPAEPDGSSCGGRQGSPLGAPGELIHTEACGPQDGNGIWAEKLSLLLMKCRLLVRGC